MRPSQLVLFCTLIMLLQACGNGVPTPNPPVDDPPTTSSESTTAISGSAVKGPLIGAIVQAHQFSASAENFIGDLLDTGETGSDGAIRGVEIPDSYTGTVILVVTADADTLDLTTGEAPVITRLITIISADQLSAETPIYATPLTTVALELAVSNSGEGSTLYPNDDDDEISEAEFLTAVSSASDQTASLLGFGLDQKIDIFSTPPVVTDAIKTEEQLAASTAYRTAIEGLSAVVILMQEAAESTDPNTTSTTTDILTAIAEDMTDGDIDGESKDGVIDAIAEIESGGIAIETILMTDPNTLNIPGTDIPITEIGQLLIDESETTSTEDTDLVASDYSAQTNITVSDIDKDGVADDIDAFPQNKTESVDTDKDGVGDNTDAFPADAGETVDSDSDGVGDNTDVFPNDPSETMDTDRDGVGDNADVFPNDPTETMDTDKDGVGDNADTFPANAGETADSDKDGVGDNTDVFPSDPTETMDTDKDGVGDNADAFPANAGETADSDKDGVGDRADAFPFDASETNDTDNDGVGNNSDNCPATVNSDQIDQNNNNIGDVCEKSKDREALWDKSNWDEADWQ